MHSQNFIFICRPHGDTKPQKPDVLCAPLELKTRSSSFKSPDSLVCFFPSLSNLRVGVIFEDFVNPLSIVGHINEDARLVESSAASAMDAYTNNNFELTILTHKRATIIPLQKKKQNKTQSRVIFICN